ncbi:Acid-sensing ion channel 2 [Mactra antiquata]
MMSGEVTMATRDDMTISELLETSFLKCYNCKSVYKDPRLLPCLHTFCQKCIQSLLAPENQSKELWNSDNQSKSSNQSKPSNETTTLTCPLCRSLMTIPLDTKGLIIVPKNTFIRDLCEMYDYKREKERNCDYCKYDGKVTKATSLCLECHDNMCQNCTGAHHRTKVTRTHKVIPYAQVQKGLYDKDIREYQAQYCNKHDEEPLNIFCEKCELLICKECKVSNHDNHKWSPADKAVKKYETQLSNLLKGLQQQIPAVHKYVQFLLNYEKSVESSKDKLISNITKQADMLHEMIEQEKTNSIDAIKEASDKEISEIQERSSNLQTAANSLENNETYLQQLINHGSSDEILSLHQEITKRLTQLTHMQMDGITARLHIQFNLGSSSQRNLQTVFGKVAIDHVPLTHSDSGLASDGALQISSMLPNVKNSPELVIQFDAEGIDDGKEVWPTGIAITKRDEFVIVDRDNKKVKIFNKHGKLQLEITGQDDNKLQTPFDVTVLKSGDIAVTDHEAENVKLYKITGEHVLTITEGVKYPRGVATNSKGEIIILDCQLNQITIHDPKSGENRKTIEAKDTKGSKVLVDPYYIAVTPQDNIVVTDTASPNIKVFSPIGKYIGNYGDYGMRDDQVLQPYGICCDYYGYMMVADNQNHRIHLLLPDGKLSKFLVTKSDSLWHPMGLAITEQGYIVMTEALGKVKVYKYI